MVTYVYINMTDGGIMNTVALYVAQLCHSDGTDG
jgi:hypothetical protein